MRTISTAWARASACLLALSFATASAQGVFPAPETFPDLRLEVAGTVNAIAKYNDGADDFYLVGGDFDLINGQPRRNLARLHADGTLDEAWGADTDGAVNALALSGDRLYVGGAFGSVDGQTRNRLARLDADDGSVAADWSPAANNIVNALQTDGSSVWAGGTFSSIDGTARALVARLDADDGDLLTAFNANVGGAVVHALLLDDGNLYIGGQGRLKGSQRALIKVAAATGAAIAWNPGIGPQGGSRIRALAADATTIYAVGRIRRADGNSRGHGARFLKTNAALQGWNPSADAEIRALAIDSATASVFVAGDFLNLGGHVRLARLDAVTGVASAGWNANADRGVASLLLDGSQLLVGGQFAALGSVGAQGGLARLASGDAAIDASFVGDAAGPGSVNAFALDAAGGVILGGSFDAARQDGELVLYPRRNLVRLLPGGGAVQRYELDRDWAVEAQGEVNAIAIDGNALYAGGNFTAINDTVRPRLAKIAADSGVLDSGWTPTADAPVRRLVADSAMGLYVLGDFITLNGSSRAGLGRIALGASGALDTAWNPAPDDVVDALLVSGSDVYLGGSFGNVGGAGRVGLARVDNLNGAADAFLADIDSAGAVHALAQSADGLLVGGQFSSIDDLARSGAARVAADGTVDAWHPNVGAGDVRALAVDGDGGFVYLGGLFSTAGGQSHPNLARAAIAGTGTVDPSWRPGTDGAVLQLAVPAAGQMLAGGAFSIVTGEMRNGVALLGMQGSDATQITIDSIVPLGGADGDNSVFGQSYEVSWTVSDVSAPDTTPTGAVTITTSGGESCGPLPAADGNCVLLAASTGARDVTANFVGDALFLDATSAAIEHTVDPANVTLIVETAPYPSSLIESVDAEITLLVIAPGTGTPAGTVQISIDGTLACAITLPATSCSLGVFPDFGFYDIEAVYTDDVNGPDHHVAAPASTVHAVGTLTSIDLSIAANATVGTPITASVTGTSLPDGEQVAITGGSGCTLTIAGNAGSCDLTFAASGPTRVTAAYAGNAGLLPSSDEATVDVLAATATLDVTLDPAAPVVGQSVTVNLATNLPDGASVSIGGAAGCSAIVLPATSCSTSFAAAGAIEVTADFAGSAQYSAASDAVNATVAKAATAFTAFDSTATGGTPGASIGFGWTHAVSAPGAGTPSGNVRVSVDGNGTAPSCVAAVAAGTCNVVFPAAGVFNLRADYLGDDDYSIASSSFIQVTISAAVTPTTLDVSLSPPAPVVGQPVTVNLATNLPPGATVSIAGAPGCTQVVLPATSCSTSFPAAGPATVTAAFAGSASFTAADDTANATVAKASTTFSALDPTATIGVPGASIGFSWTLTVVSPGQGTPTGNVRVSVDGDGSAPSCTVAVSAGACNLVFPDEGVFELRADYLGDDNYDVVSSSFIEVTIVAAAPTDADLQIGKVVSRSRLAAGIEQVEFMIVVGNEGPASVVGAAIADLLPTGLSAAVWTCVPDGAGASCSAPNGTGNVALTADLVPGSTVTILLQADVDDDAPNVVANTATVTAPIAVTDPMPGNNSSTAFYQACRGNSGPALTEHFCLFGNGFEGNSP